MVTGSNEICFPKAKQNLKKQQIFLKTKESTSVEQLKLQRCGSTEGFGEYHRQIM